MRGWYLGRAALLVLAGCGGPGTYNAQAGMTTSDDAAALGSPASGPPFHDSIPKEFWGTFAPSLPGCNAEYGVDLIEVSADNIHYYEGDDYLLIGVTFFGASTKSGKSVPLFNGRFTGRNETQLLGEMNVRMELETPNQLIRYVLKADGEPDTKPADIWVRCPAAKK